MKIYMEVTEYSGSKEKEISAVVYVNLQYIPELNVKQTETKFFETLRQIMRNGYATWLEKTQVGA